MSTNADEAKQTRLLWLVRVGYVLMAVGILLLLLLGVLLPVNLFEGLHHYYRVVPAEHGWILPASLVGLGMLLVLVGWALRTGGR
ncbi:hypothetical protein J7E70_34565 [Variovorax paradoxus]|nr:hypothetical protein [Variovorax paradoxus]MBT2305516.1 hypothetical protein [Variovorax paradoxus]